MTAKRNSSADRERAQLKALDRKIKALLPPQYHNCYETVSPESMGSASLRYGPDGRVAWDDIWTSFCQLALAGGPPHRGTLLEPASRAEVAAEPRKYQQVVEEIGRGVWLTTGLNVLPLHAPGWVGVVCQGEAMAGWLVRAIIAENLSVRQDGRLLLVPAGPDYRLAKEIKNVVTAVAKTCHYWSGHITEEQRQAAAAPAAPLLAPALAEEVQASPQKYHAVVTSLEKSIEQAGGLTAMPSQSPGWVGAQCPDVATTVWLLRALAVANILVRREESVLYLPAHPHFTAGQVGRIGRSLARASRLHAAWRPENVVS
jgi:hypothetical protein